MFYDNQFHDNQSEKGHVYSYTDVNENAEYIRVMNFHSKSKLSQLAKRLFRAQ